MRIVEKLISTIAFKYGFFIRPPKEDERWSFQYRDPKHTPWNKRRGEVAYSVATIDVEQCPLNEKGLGDWITFTMEEMTMAKEGGRHVSRTISITLNGAHRAALLQYLRDTETVNDGTMEIGDFVETEVKQY